MECCPRPRRPSRQRARDTGTSSIPLQSINDLLFFFFSFRGFCDSDGVKRCRRNANGGTSPEPMGQDVVFCIIICGRAGQSARPLRRRIAMTVAPP